MTPAPPRRRPARAATTSRPFRPAAALERACPSRAPPGSRGSGRSPEHSGPSASTTTWPSSPPSPCAPRKISPPVDDAAADARAERQHHQLARADRVGLGERGAARVVVDVDRHSEPPAQLLAQRHARERDVHARHHRAGRPLDLRWDADPDRVRLPGDWPSPRAPRPRSRRAARRSTRAASDARPRAAPRRSVDRGDRDLGSAYVHAEEAGHQRVIHRPVIEVGPWIADSRPRTSAPASSPARSR